MITAVARLFDENVARPMIQYFITVSEASIRAIVRNCSWGASHPLSPTIQRCGTFAYGKGNSGLTRARVTIPSPYPKAELHAWPR